MGEPTKVRTFPDLHELPGSALLTRSQVAAVSNFSVPTLRHWAASGRGPRVRIVEGRPRYAASDIQAWLAGEDSPSPL